MKNKRTSTEPLEISERVNGIVLPDLTGTLDNLISKLSQLKQDLEKKGYYNITLDYDINYDDPDDLYFNAIRLETPEEVQQRLDLEKWKKDETQRMRKESKLREKKQLERLIKKHAGDKDFKELIKKYGVKSE